MRTSFLSMDRGDGADGGLDDGLKWRGRVSDSDSDEDVFGLYAERTGAAFDEFVHQVGGIHDDDDDDDDDFEYDEDDPLDGLVTIGNIDRVGGASGTSIRQDRGLSRGTDGSADPSPAASDDYIKQLEEVIERDMPKVKITDEYQKVLDAVDASDGALVGDDQATKNADGGRRTTVKRDVQIGEGHTGDGNRNGDPDGNEESGAPSASGSRSASDRLLRGEDEDADGLPDLGAILGTSRKDRDVDTLAELIDDLAFDEKAEREKQRRGMFFEDAGGIGVQSGGDSDDDDGGGSIGGL